MAESRPKSTCPCPNTHRRLDQCHRLWHQAAEHYGDPPNFITNLNAVVQALRSVSLMLQSEKADLPRFEEWYSDWQERAKQDRLMKWLNDARVQVFHVSELKTRSFVHARLILSGPVAEATFEVPVEVPTAFIATHLSLFALPPVPQVLRENMILSVERQWMCEEVDDVELLDILAHCYAELVSLARVAHTASAVDLHSCQLTRPVHDSDAYVEGRPLCMHPHDERRIVRIDLNDGEPLSLFRERRGAPTAEELRAAATRYGMRKPDHQPPPETLKEFCKTHAFAARKLLVKDRYLQRVIFLRVPDGSFEVHEIHASSKAEKTVLIEIVAQRVEQVRADLLIDVGETWFSTPEQLRAKHFINSNDALGRKEAISVTAVNSSGERYSLITPFRRGIFGGIKLSDTEEYIDQGPGYLEPVYKVWGLKPVQGAGPERG